MKEINSDSLKYGRAKEDEVFVSHSQYVSCHHKNGTVSKVGMFIDRQRPWLSATADGILTCDCHGRRLIEIKCPYTTRHMTADERVADQSSYIYDNQLKYGHKYFVQVQLQMHVYDISSCDFIVKSFDRNTVIVVHRDDSFIDSVLPTLQLFWENHVIPELLTRKVERQTKDTPSTSSDSLFCYCRQPEDDREYVGCDGVSCPFKWIHIECIRPKRKTAPKGKWYCKACKSNSK